MSLMRPMPPKVLTTAPEGPQDEAHRITGTRRPRIQFIAAADPVAGAPHQAMAGLWLANRGYEVHFLGLGESTRDRVETPLGRIPAKFLPDSTWNKFGGLALEVLRRRLRSGPGTIFYIAGSPVIGAALVGLAGLPADRVVYHMQDFLDPGNHPWWCHLERMAARKAGVVILNEPNRARFMASHYRLKRLPIVVRTALPKSWPIPERSPELRRQLLGGRKNIAQSDTKLIAVGGPYSEVRCTAEALQAVGMLPRNYLLMFTGAPEGSDAYKKLLSALRRTGTQDRAVILGKLPFQELLAHFACCDMGLLLYPNNSLGNYYQSPGRLTEYIGCGVPVVASDFLPFELLVLRHRIGRVCRSDAPTDIARAIREIGERSEDENCKERERLRNLAQTELAYDNEATRIERALAQHQWA